MSIRGSDFSFRVFRVFRGSTHSCTFVSIRGSGSLSCISCVSWFNPFVYIRVHLWFCFFFSCISCVSWFNPFVYIRVHSWFCFFFSCISCPFVVLFFLFVYFVCFVVQSIRADSWFLDQFQRKIFQEMLEATCFPRICSNNYSWRSNLIGKISVGLHLFLVCLQQVVQHSITLNPRSLYEEDIHPD